MASAMRDVYNIIRRRREKLGTRRGEEENAGDDANASFSLRSP